MAVDVPAPPPAAVRITRIEPSGRRRFPDLGEALEARELLLLLTWRDIKVRYKQTALGALWAILQPVLTMVVFTLIFERVGKVSSYGVPYPVFSLAALTVWTFFTTGLMQTANSLVGNVALLTKVYFPRILIPIGAVASGLIDLGISVAVLAVVMLRYGVTPPIQILLVPVLVAMAAATTLGAGAGLGALNVRYRDVRFVLPFLTQLWLFATPVAYPSTLLDEPWRSLSAINPMTGVVEGFRWAVLGVDNDPGLLIAISALASVAVLVAGVHYFARVERSFADVA